MIPRHGLKVTKRDAATDEITAARCSRCGLVWNASMALSAWVRLNLHCGAPKDAPVEDWLGFICGPRVDPS